MGERGVAVFDLDSTLFDNRPRQARILREFGDAAGIPELASCSHEHWTSSWLMKEAMVAAGLAEERAEGLMAEAVRFWEERFFHPEYCLEDSPIPGAASFVQRLHEKGCRIAYCTARHEPMRGMTIESLRRNGFPSPTGERVFLVMKEARTIVDDDFKRAAHEALRHLGEVIAAFDNEPTHINDYFRSFPEALVVHLATDHSGRPVAVHEAIPQIADFLV